MPVTRNAETLLQDLHYLARQALGPAYDGGLPVDRPNFVPEGVSEVTFHPGRRSQPGTYVKAQLNYVRRHVTQPLPALTVRAERCALEQVRKLDITVPETRGFVERRTFAGPFGALTTMELEEYHSLEDLLTTRPGTAEAERMLRACAQTLARLHGARWAHGACYPKHLLLRPRADSYDVALIDLETTRRRATHKRAIARDLPRLVAGLGKLGPEHVDPFVVAYAASSRIGEKALRRLLRHPSPTRHGAAYQ